MTKALYTAEAHVTGGRANGHGRTRRRRAGGRSAPAFGDGRTGRRHQPRGAVRGRLRRLLRGRARHGRAAQQAGDRRRGDRLQGLADHDRGARLHDRRRAARHRCPTMQDAGEAVELVRAAHQVCPYSNATRGNIEVLLTRQRRARRLDARRPTGRRSRHQDAGRPLPVATAPALLPPRSSPRIALRRAGKFARWPMSCCPSSWQPSRCRSSRRWASARTSRRRTPWSPGRRRRRSPCRRRRSTAGGPCR